MRLLPALLAALALIGCTPAARLASTASPASETDGLTRAKIGQTVAVGGPKVTPLAVLEDSRCPMNARCVWAGRVRLSVRIDLGRGGEMRELTQGTPMPVADGTLELVEVRPDKLGAIKSEDYRFALRFMGGL